MVGSSQGQAHSSQTAGAPGHPGAPVPLSPFRGDQLEIVGEEQEALENDLVLEIAGSAGVDAFEDFTGNQYLDKTARVQRWERRLAESYLLLRHAGLWGRAGMTAEAGVSRMEAAIEVFGVQGGDAVGKRTRKLANMVGVDLADESLLIVRIGQVRVFDRGDRIDVIGTGHKDGRQKDAFADTLAEVLVMQDIRRPRIDLRRVTPQMAAAVYAACSVRGVVPEITVNGKHWEPPQQATAFLKAHSETYRDRIQRARDLGGEIFEAVQGGTFDAASMSRIPLDPAEVLENLGHEERPRPRF